MSHGRPVRLLSPEQLESLSTPRLLAYRNRLLALEDSAALSDRTPAELSALDRALVHFKDDPRWPATHSAVISLLRTRPHRP